jgi:hypothetical protein
LEIVNFLFEARAMLNQIRNRCVGAAVVMLICLTGGCGILAPMTDSPSVDAVRGDQPIIQPDGYHGIMDGDDPHFDSGSFLGGFSGELGR